MPEDFTVTSPTILDSTGRAIAAALENISAAAPQVVDNLTTSDPTSALSAKMGKKLNDEKYEKPVSGIPSTDLSEAVQTSLGKADTAVQPEDIKPGAKYASVTIAAADWSNGTCTKNVLGMNSNYIVILSADTSSVNDYLSSNIKCVAQGSNSLTFGCDTTPSNSVTVNVLCFEAEPLAKPISLTISGNWSNTQYIGDPVDYTGLTFTASYEGGATATVLPTSVSPANWGNTIGIQTATFSYTESGITVSATKTANVANPGSESSIPLTIKATTSCEASITKTGNPGTIYYSVNGIDRGELASGYSVTLSGGDEISFFRTLSSDLNTSNYFTIKCTNSHYIFGNIMSLYNKDNFENLDTISYKYAFYKLFYRSGNTYGDLIDPSVGKLLLPATALSDGCYNNMFYGCKGITNIPSDLLPATTLSYGCYQSMFGNCKGLTSLPANLLPATTLARSCYNSMFSDCTNITTVPSNFLSATTLFENCYCSMFYNCTSLTTAPALPATTLAISCYREMFRQCSRLASTPTLSSTALASRCYEGMFYDCRALTSAPSLPATTLQSSCYENMFRGCTSLASIPSISATTLAAECYEGMFYNCTSITTIPSDLLTITTLEENCYSQMFQECSSITSLPANLLPATTLAPYCYNGMFADCSGLTSIPSGFLPATTLAANCYGYMFSTCGNLTSVPSGLLPATTLQSSCYENMFEYSGLTSIPSGLLSATTLAGGCYQGMFLGCTSITTVPSNLLPATTLAESCYSYMFGSCESLTNTPNLPATTLADYCYSDMFSYCYMLQTVSTLPATTLAEGCYQGMFRASCSEYHYFGESPVLPAQTLVTNCYKEMFDSCAELYKVTCLATDISAEDCVYDWLNNTSDGTLYKAASMDGWVVGENIPYDWSIDNYQG